MSGIENLARFALSRIDSVPVSDRPALLREAAQHVPEDVAQIALTTAALIEELGRHQLELFTQLEK